MGKRFIPERTYESRRVGEIEIARDIAKSMRKDGRPSGHLAQFDFDFVSNQEDKLQILQRFLSERYPYTFEPVKKHGWRRWCLHGETSEIPCTDDNLLFWVLDMFDRGFTHDAELYGYGSLFDPDDVRFLDTESKSEDFYFNIGMKAYDSGDRSGALIAWNIVASMNPENAEALYSRAIVKAELHAVAEAMLDYDQAIEIAPDFWSALTNRGCLKGDNGDHAGAIEDHTRIIDGAKKGSKSFVLAYANRGNSKLSLGDTGGACSDWKTAEGLGADFVAERIQKHCADCD